MSRAVGYRSRCRITRFPLEPKRPVVGCGYQGLVQKADERRQPFKRAEQRVVKARSRRKAGRMLAPGQKLLQFEVFRGRVLLCKPSGYTLEPGAAELAEAPAKHRRLYDRAQPSSVVRHVFPNPIELTRFWGVDAAADQHMVGVHVEIQASSTMLGQRSMRKDRGDMCFERCLVGREPGVAIDPVHRELRRGYEIGREPGEIESQLVDDLNHRRAHVCVVVGLSSAEPVAVIVALERAQELQCRVVKSRSRHGRCIVER